MKPKVSLSHVAVLVPSVRKAADFLSRFGFEIGEEEVFSETREIYVQGGARNSLLLMEPKKSGSYRRALQKRGPGLHHFAIDVLDIEGFLASLSGSGWLLHSNSLKTLQSSKTVYLARPGFPALIEVQETRELKHGPLFVEKVFLKLHRSHAAMVKAVGLGGMLRSSSGKQCFIADGNTVDLKRLFAQ